MERKAGGKNDNLTGRLTQSCRGYSFVQAVRLILHELRAEKSVNENLKNKIKIRPELSLDFPGTDITKVRRKDDGFEINATFLGLYGVSSPLPTFYTEELMQDVDDDITVTRDFIDIINRPLYQLFSSIWSRCRLAYKVCEEKEPAYINRLFSLSGLPDDAFRDAVGNAMLINRYIGILTQFPRSAEGLRCILSDILNADKIRIEQCSVQDVPLDKDNILRLGEANCELGEDSISGDTVKDMSGSFTIELIAKDAEELHSLLPDTENFRIMNEMTEYYTDQALGWKADILIDSDKVDACRLGGDRWSRLGWNTWLGKPEDENTQQKISLTG